MKDERVRAEGAKAEHAAILAELEAVLRGVRVVKTQEYESIATGIRWAMDAVRMRTPGDAPRVTTLHTKDDPMIATTQDGSTFGVHAGRVSLDDGPSWRCYLQPGRWNGWGRPLFDEETTRAIARYVNANVDGIRLLWDPNAKRWEEIDESPACEPSHVTDYDPVTIDGRTYWDIGSSAWCWWVEDPE